MMKKFTQAYKKQRTAISRFSWSALYSGIVLSIMPLYSYAISFEDLTLKRFIAHVNDYFVTNTLLITMTVILFFFFAFNIVRFMHKSATIQTHPCLLYTSDAADE